MIGVHDGHNASASIVKDGVLQFAVQEERMVGRKNFYGFPVKSTEASSSASGTSTTWATKPRPTSGCVRIRRLDIWS
ncbi:MAG: hypothetical protein M3N28_02045 [Actinomycetota bacterium]|nr:hypothetical protein [Actinomycetota bacterium]